MAVIQNISFFAGDTKPIDGTVDADLTGVTIRFSVKKTMGSTEILLLKDTSNGITITKSTPNGEYTLTLSPDETTRLQGTNYYEVEIVDVLGNVTTVTTGIIKSNTGAVNHSYITIEDADNYFMDMLFPEPWNVTDEAQKEKALVAATRKIDSQMLIGRKIDVEQPLEFPRSIYSDSLSRWVDETEVSEEVLNAVCEEALSLLRGGIQAQKRAELQRMGVTSFSLGPLSEAYSGASSNGNKLSSTVAVQLLSRYTGGSRTIS